MTSTTRTGQRLLNAPHVVEFSRTGYGLQHPIACRPDLIKCPLNRWLARQAAPAMKPGRYLMAGPSQFEPLPKDWTDPLVPSVVAAIEAEARQQEREALAAEVAAIPEATYEQTVDEGCVSRAAVLSILRGEKP
jgi:hypothetical protein